MLNPFFYPFPVLETERLLLRRVTMKDAPELFYFRSDPAILQYLGRDPVKTMDEAIQFIKRIEDNIVRNEAILWGIELKTSPGKLAGTITYWHLQKEHYRAEIGYLLAPAYWKKGFMREALNKVMEYGFRVMGLHSVEARLSPGNRASAALLEASGFVKEAHFKEDFFYNGKFEDTLVYACLNPGTPA
jgi:[ribosomal protein S5]-alanine N-acetyltransferase